MKIVLAHPLPKILAALIALAAWSAASAQQPRPTIDPSWDEAAPASIVDHLPGQNATPVSSANESSDSDGNSDVNHEAAPPTDAQRFTDLEKKFKDLEKLVKENAPEKEPKDAWVDMSTDKWTVKLGGHVQMDWIHWPSSTLPAAVPQDYFEFRRLRLTADGTGYGVYDFRVMIDIEPESGDGATGPVTDIKDAYFTLHEVALLQRWRIGNFFVPYGLEQVTNDTMNIFLERSIPTQGIFTADREVGMAFYGINDAQNFTWTGGVFIDSISESLKERIDDNQGFRASGRLTCLPYYDEASNGRYLVHLGTGVLYTLDQDGLVRFRARPQIHEGPFVIDTGPIAAKSYTSGNIEMATVWGPLSIQSELYATNVDRTVGGGTMLYGAYAYFSYFLTGENRVYERYGQHGAQFGRNVPYSNFFAIPGSVSPGAWEFKCRTSYLDLDNVNSGHYNDITVGFNWYWSDRVRVMFDWIHPWTSVASTPFGASRSDVIGVRFDFNF